MATTLTTPDHVSPTDDGYILSSSEDDAPAPVISTAGATIDPSRPSDASGF
jgi:RNA polymerase primary sigma factor